MKYQSMGILLAAEIAERVSGEPLPKFLERELFLPLGMKRTAFGLGRFSIPDTAQCQVDAAPGLYGGGTTDAKSWDWNSPYWRNLAAPWGGAHSTGPDIATFLGAFSRLTARCSERKPRPEWCSTRTTGSTNLGALASP